ILDLDYSRFKFYAQKSSARHFDGGGIYNFISLALSIAIKSTTFESLVRSDKFNPSYRLVDGISKDGVSAMIVDMIKRITNKELISLDRMVRLVGPYVVGDSYSLDPYFSGITLSNVEIMLKTFYSQITLELGKKLASHEIFLVSLVNLLNNEFTSNIKYVGQLSSKTNLKKAISDLLSNTQFRTKIIKLAEASNLRNLRSQFEDGKKFSGLTVFLTITNFEKLFVELPNGQFKLGLVFDYNPHFKTNTPLAISDFPAGNLYTMKLNYRDGLMPISDNSELQNLFNLKNSQGLMIGSHPDYPNSVILIPSDRISDLKKTDIQLGYKFGSEIYYSFASDNAGLRLSSRLRFTSSGITLRRPNWYQRFYEYEASFKNGEIVGYQSNFYAAYTFGTGREFTLVLQDTTVFLEHMDPFKDPLHNFISKARSKVLKGLPNYIVPAFKDHNTLKPGIKNDLIEVFSLIDQFVNSKLSKVRYKDDVISDLVISQAFYDKDLSLIKTLLNDLDPTLDQLSDLSYSKQKVFYNTIHEILKGYSGSNKFINDYKVLHDYLTFNDIHSNEFTNNEIKAVEMIEEILPEIFGYRFTALLKLGALLFYKEDGIVKFQPVAFSRWLAQDMLNARRFKAVNAKDNKIYSYPNIAGNFEDIMTCIMAFGYQTTFNVKDKGDRTLPIFAADYDTFVIDLVKGTYHRPYNPDTRSKNYGTLTHVLRRSYENIVL
ncbi:hypothetical protein LCGC14_2042440, partial [marine sediment metagenome]